MPIDPGRFWARVTLETPTATANSLGEPVLSWSTFATVWANVEPLSAREAIHYGEVLGIMSHKVTMRYLEGLTSAMRIDYKGRRLEIGQINEREKLFYHELIATERRTDA